jgi:hypothetical protein
VFFRITLVKIGNLLLDIPTLSNYNAGRLVILLQTIITTFSLEECRVWARAERDVADIENLRVGE